MKRGAFRASIPLKERLKHLKPIQPEHSTHTTPSTAHHGEVPVTQRLFVGGIDRALGEEAVRQQLSRFGEVVSIEMKDKHFKEALFAHVDVLFRNDLDLQRCLSTLNTLTWKGKKLRVERARNDPLTELRKRWLETA